METLFHKIKMPDQVIIDMLDSDEDQLDELSGREDAEVNRNLFKDEHGFHTAFFLHDSIKKSYARRYLTRDIERHGGIVLDTDIGSDTVLVDAMYAHKDTLQIAYNTADDPRFRKVFVESASFIQHCIQHNHFGHRIPAQKGMGGTIGRTRVPFTREDDERLSYYLARNLPDKTTGGRCGHKVYDRLAESAIVKKDTHGWGARHPAASWRERYKKNAPMFDEWITDIAKQEGQSKKQLWPENRRVTQKGLQAGHVVEADSSDGNSDEEPPPPPRKRRPSDYLPSPKRPRLIQPLSHQQVRTGLSIDRKGKARAFEEEEDTDEADQLEAYVDQNKLSEPGPSRSRRSLEATNVAVNDLTHRTQPNTTSFFTQKTIVAPTTSGKSAQSKEASPLLDKESRPLVRRSIQVIRETKQPSPFKHKPIPVIDLTSSPARSFGRDSPVVQLSPTRTLVNPFQTQEVPPSTYKRPLKAARRPRAMIKAAVLDAPYRNTRSRSQSVESLIPNFPVRRKKIGKKETPELPVVDEIQDDDGRDNEDLEAVDEISSLLGENLVDEIDVEKMLVSGSTNQNEDIDNVRGVSLDTDDAQTEQNLRPTQPRQASSRKHPSDMLREYQECSVIWSQKSIPLSTRPRLSNKPVVLVRNTQEKPGSISPPSQIRNLPATYKAAGLPRTPSPRPRKNSTSSTDSFPISGTRASALKKKLQRQEKHSSSYQFSSGTRAANFAGSRR